MGLEPGRGPATLLGMTQRSPFRGSVRGTSLEQGRGSATLPRMTQRSPFRYFKTSPEVIRLAVMLYVRFPLSLRNVEDLLHERGIEVSHETVRFWWQRFGSMFAAEIRKRRVAGLHSSRAATALRCLRRVLLPASILARICLSAPPDHLGRSIVTASGDGVAVAEQDGESFTRPAKKVTLVSTHGAGDTVTGVLDATLVGGVSLPEAARTVDWTAARHLARLS